MSFSAVAASELSPGAALISDRFHVERVLGRGGMGEVLAVREAASGKRFALKRLLPGAKPRHALLLQREFHTLASLRHPSIVRAFDFGQSADGAYYTMELLAGSDMEKLAPLPWSQVVPILRDVASALSLIHARRLVHRDLGARNVWRSEDGTIKLIDFGALTGFGASNDIAGTAPYIAPEALRTHVLDQRTDLFSVGALGYYLLTGRHAFAAHSIGELEQNWAAGYRPLAERVVGLAREDLPAVPELLEHLIDALLAASPDARPASSAEVLDRLDEVLPGAAGVSQGAVDAILASKAFAGRSVERKRLRACLDKLPSAGASIALIGPRGAGRSRLLAEFGMEARLAGQRVIEVNGDAGQSPLSVVNRAVMKAFEVFPTAAHAAARPHASVLGHISEELRALLSLSPEQLERFPEVAGEGRLRVQGALEAFWCALSAECPVILLLDDLESMDEASGALFTTLGREAKRNRLLIVAAVRSERDLVPSGVAKAFVAKSHVLPLDGLGAADCEQMLCSIFGDVEHLGRTAHHLAALAEGNPGRLIELCEYLVHAERIRCVEGVWILPQEVSELGVSASAEELGAARLADASEDARALASRLSVKEGVISIELCAAMSPVQAASLFAAIDELCVRRVLSKVDAGYVFRSDALRSTLLAKLDKEEAERIHRLVGTALLGLEQPTETQRMEAGLHFMKGGQVRRGAEIAQSVAVKWASNMSEDNFSIGYTMETAYLQAQTLNLSDAEKLSFLSALSCAGFFADRRFGFTYGDEALRCGARVCGMDTARKLSPWLGKKLGLIVAMLAAAISLRKQAKTSSLVPSFGDAIRIFMTASGCLAGMYTVCLAREKVLECAQAIEPLTALGKDHIAYIVQQFSLACATTISERNGRARERWRQLMKRLNDPRPIKGITDTNRMYYQAASMYAWGGSECWRDNSLSMENAKWLDQQPLKLYQVSADQVRAQYLAQQGKTKEVAECRARLEVAALKRNMTWQVELWWPCSSVAIATRQRDAMTLKRAVGQLRQLSAGTPSLRDFVDYAQGSYLLLRGKHREALTLLEQVSANRNSEDIGHANIAGLIAAAHNALGDFTQAERVARDAIERLCPEDLDAAGLTLRVRIEHALGLAGLGQHERAASQLDELIARFEPEQGPLTLGSLHEARAQVALRAKQEKEAQKHFDLMEQWYRSTDCSSLIQHCDRVARRRTIGRGGSKENAHIPGVSFLVQASSRLTSLQQEPEDILTQVVRGAMAKEGALLFTSSDGQRRNVKTRADDLPHELRAWLDDRLSSALIWQTATEDSEDVPTTDANVLRVDDQVWRLHVLYSEDDLAEQQVVGALVLRSPAADVPLDVQRAIASQLRGGYSQAVSYQA